VEALADNLRILLQSPELCREMGRKAYEHARKNFDFDLFLARYEELYAKSRAASSSRLK
jgi:glycosyltransferase involved in cell wall biosynthesis